MEFFNPTSDVPYLLTLPPPGCPVIVTMFSPSINKLSIGGAHDHHLQIVGATGSMLGRIPLINSGCSFAYIRGSRSINLPAEAFTVRFVGVSQLGYSFEARHMRQYTAPFPPLRIHTRSAPTDITRGTDAIYCFQLFTTQTYSGCHLHLPISTEVQTDMKGVTLFTNEGGTFNGSYIFDVRVKVSRDAPIKSGAMVLRIYDSRRKIVLQSTATIEVEVSSL